MLQAVPDQQIQIRLVTTEEEYKIDQNVFSLASTSSPPELQDLLKNLLDIAEEDVEFSFRVGDELLQHTIGKYCEQTRLTGEDILDVYYFKKRSISEDVSVHEVDDWVGSVAISKDFVYAGLYNGQVTRISSDGTSQTLGIHDKPIKTVSVVKSWDDKELIVTGSLDQNLGYSVVSQSGSVEKLYTLRGHTETVTGCSVSPSREQLASTSWDTYLKVWSTSLENQNDKEQKKKEGAELIRTPILTLGGHAQVATDCVWKDNSQILTVSYDMTVKLWDIQLMSCVETLQINSALQCVDWSDKAKLVATGSSDRYVRLFDPRGGSEKIVHSTLIGHETWVSGVSWSPISDVELVSASYDNTTLLWDIRTTKSYLAVLGKHEDKVLCCAWDEGRVVSGSADKTLRISRL